MDVLNQPWAWYVAGPIIAIVYFLMKWFGNRFGISSTLRTQCAILGAGKKVKFFDFDWKSEIWNLFFVFGAILGGFVAATFFTNPEPVQIAESTQQALLELGVTSFQTNELEPTELFSNDKITSIPTVIYLLIAGVFVGFGTRYAGGCTSGHAISGLANLQLPSLIAVIGFFIGGLLMVWIILPKVLPFVIN